MLLIESQILPPISTFISGIRHQEICIEAHENYQKKSFRNRFQLSSPRGRTTISIPLKKGKSNQLPIKNVEISYDQDWIKSLSHTLITLLGRAAFFEYFYPEIMSIFQAKYKSLYELNMTLLNWCVKAAEMDVKISLSSEFVKAPCPPITDGRNLSLSFYKNPTSNNYIEYDQIFMIEHGLICNLSVLDLIMNRGPETGLLIKKHVEESF